MVLLILAAVAIGSVRESDIIGYAQNAAGSYNQAKANEVSELSLAEELINKFTSDDLEERLRIALEKQVFKQDSEDLQLILDEKSITIDDMQRNIFVVPVDSEQENGETSIYMFVILDANTYSYFVDEEEQKFIVANKNHPGYEHSQLIKNDLLEVCKVFVGKNIEDFEQEKVDENNWKIKGISVLGKNEITGSYLDSFTSSDGTFFEGYFNIDYIENWGIDLILEGDNLSDGKIHGKIVRVGLNDR